jgi:hypothetical protein
MAERLLVALLLVAGAAFADQDPPTPPAVVAERDLLLEKIVRGEEYEASVRRFAALIASREKSIATSAAAKKRLSDERDEMNRLRREWDHSADSRVASRCILTPDPRAPIVPVGKHDHPADWGKVARKLVITLPPRNALDAEKRSVTIYEVVGQARRYVFSSPRDAEELAREGDMVLLCVQPNTWTHDMPVILDHKVDALPKLGEGQFYPPEWNGLVVHVSMLIRIARAPRVVDKARWRPLHVEDNEFENAIRRVKWRLPPEQLVMATFEVRADLGGGRYEIAGRRDDKSWILETPPNLPRRELLRPYHHVWGIVGKPRFDAELKKLVLEAVDVEERYLLE